MARGWCAAWRREKWGVAFATTGHFSRAKHPVATHIHNLTASARRLSRGMMIALLRGNWC